MKEELGDKVEKVMVGKTMEINPKQSILSKLKKKAVVNKVFCSWVDCVRFCLHLLCDFSAASPL
eukprot:6874435-Heterocapsa_arctica.AAC.1